MACRPVLLIVDVQEDFMAASGALAVPGAEAIRPALRALSEVAVRHQVPRWATMDTHTPDDPEFAAYGFPAHCVAGTPGWALIPEVDQGAYRTVRAAADLVGAGDRIFLKATFDIFSNPLFAQALALMGPSEVIVCGVATDYCVKAAVLGLCQAGYAVSLVGDAIEAVAADSGAVALAEMRRAGARVIDRAEAIARLEQAAAHVA